MQQKAINEAVHVAAQYEQYGFTSPFS